MLPHTNAHRRRLVLALLAATAASSAAAQVSDLELLKHANPVHEWEDAAMVLVFNATDDDVQIFIEGSSEPALRRVFLFGGSSLILNLRLSDPENLGQADFVFESPEPSMEDLMRSYPPGNYLFAALTVEGDVLVSESELVYEFLDAPVITFPVEGDEDVPTRLTVTWEPIDDAESVIFEIEDEGEGRTLAVDLPGDATAFTLPDGFLERGTVYTIDVEGVHDNGNITVSDVEFTTAD